MIRTFGEDILQVYKWSPYPQDYEYLEYNDPLNAYEGQIFVRTTTGNALTLEFYSFDSLYDLRHRYAAKEGDSSGRFMFGGKQLEDDFLLKY